MTRITRILADEGLRRRGYRLTPDLGRILRDVQTRGLRIDTVFDIGAHTGTWTHMAQAYVPRDCEFYLFEANSTHSEELQSTGYSIFNVVLGSSAGTAEFYASGGTGDSLFRENTPFYDSVSAETVDVVTLDHVVEHEGLPLPDFVKIDTQGSEVEILQGGHDSLRQTQLLLLEMPIVRYNSGAPGFDAYIDTARNLGFVPFRLVESHTGNGLLLQVDILFISMNALETLFGSDAVSWANRLSGFSTGE